MANEKSIRGIIGEAASDAKTVSLVGYLANEDEHQLWIQDRHCTWIINKADIAGSKKLEPTIDGSKTTAICVFIRDGAEIYEMKPLKIDFDAKPITMCDPRTIPEVVGEKDLGRMAKRWTRHLGMKDQARGCSSECTPWTTTCTYHVPGDGTEIIKDDSECDWIDIC